MGIRIGFLSTFPSTQCGIATFCESLVTQFGYTTAEVGVVRLLDAPEVSPAPVVGAWMTTGGDEAARHAAAILNTYDVVIIQHEYGIFGGPDGQDVLALTQLLHVPIVLVLHTVLTTPTPNQRRILADLLDAAAGIITMTETARARLGEHWQVPGELVTVIPHGATDNRDGPARISPREGEPSRPVVLTWGLLSQGKGIEWALTAMADLRGHAPLPRYRIVGQTHPRVLEREGEAYRTSLQLLVDELDLADCVEFDSRYLGATDLLRVVREADVILLPYDSPEQVTSGVLTEAVAAGKPVISTSFPHAVELLSSGAGILVPRRDPGAITAALTTVLTDPDAARDMARASRQLATTMLWPVVTARYLDLANRVHHESKAPSMLTGLRSRNAG